MFNCKFCFHINKMFLIILEILIHIYQLSNIPSWKIQFSHHSTFIGFSYAKLTDQLTCTRMRHDFLKSKFTSHPNPRHILIFLVGLKFLRIMWLRGIHVRAPWANTVVIPDKGLNFFNSIYQRRCIYNLMILILNIIFSCKFIITINLFLYY